MNVRTAVAIAALVLSVSIEGQKLNYSCSWIGNTYGGGDERWVQDWVEGMYVAPDGTVYTNAFWDESGREVGVYHDGKPVALANHTHGWGYTGGRSVTANTKYLYFAQSVNNEGGNLKDPDTWPAKGNAWHGVSRRLLSDIQKGAPFSGGKGGKGDTLAGCFLVVNDVSEKTDASIVGLAASGTVLYASDPANNRILLYNAESMERVREWSVNRPGPLAFAPDGTLWCLRLATSEAPARFLHFDLQGKELPDSMTMPKRIEPRAMAFDAKGRLFVADDGADQNVKVYKAGSIRPTIEIGVKGGVLAGPTPGLTGPHRFHDLSGVGVDARGRVYVANGYGRSGDGVGTELECCNMEGGRLWNLLGLLFVDQAGIDSSSDADLYAKHEHFVLDYSRRKPGTEWSYRGFTLDRFRFPQDPRLHVNPTTVWVRNIAGRRFLYMTDMYSSFLAIYRFDATQYGELAIPCGYFSKEPDRNAKDQAWPPHRPSTGEWIWVDSNGDGAFQADEYRPKTDGTNAPPLWGWCVDSRGDVWQATERDGIRLFKLSGLNSKGCPVYDYSGMTVQQTPSLFNNLQRAQYDSRTDTVYLSGYTDQYPNDHGYWKVIGRVIACVDKWSAGNRTPIWTKNVSVEDPDNKAQVVMPASFTVEGGTLFTVEVKDARIEVYNRLTGEHVGTMTPGPEVGGKSGWVDVPYGIEARLRNDGEYEILVEEDWRGKDILYRWKP